MNYSLGVDIGSTTAKAVLIDDNGEILYSTYERHYSKVLEKCRELLENVYSITGDSSINFAISGSAGLGISEAIRVPFIQEVVSESEVVKHTAPDTSCIIELGGEDAKIVFFDGGIDERMNGTCAGGTGAFIDQMATLLNVTTDELDSLSLDAQRIYPVASRCGVFAKTDIQPLINQGARKEDIAKSIFQAVVNQTIAGLAQGRTISGKVMFLGGPLSFFKGLRDCFKETLKLSDEDVIFPDYAKVSVALGAAFYASTLGHTYNIKDLLERVSKATLPTGSSNVKALFENENEYNEFIQRHEKATVPKRDIASYRGCAYLGIDCGSTTTKLVLISENREILYTYYSSNKGNPVDVVKNCLQKIYKLCKSRIRIKGSAVTGYGEELIKNAFSIDYGIVETLAHFTAAKHFKSDVDFILDIGGQDIKCFKIHNGAIDSIMLNEACSSGCGSFLETFSKSLGYSAEEFAQKGIFAKRPVNLGSRCTVFMNSSVKQAQKEGATVEDISAGLAVSVVKNAIYKVIRAGSADELGENIVVQGGTFYNNAVLRAFEKELGRNVIRPEISGLMGAYGAALYAMRATLSSIISEERLSEFSHTATGMICKGCTNNCHLTLNKFSDGSTFISGNQCQRGAGLKEGSSLPNLYEFKRNLLLSEDSFESNKKTIGLPLALGMYELLPLWKTIFKELGFNVLVSPMSSRELYEKGQFSIPSDTACYPAKLMHGHIMSLLEKKADAIFYPCLTYNINEKLSDNHYNCPVVAYYSELLSGNVERLKDTVFLFPYLNINSKRELSRGLYDYLNASGIGSFTKREIKKAVSCGYSALKEYRLSVLNEGKKALDYAKAEGKDVMILAGRPYHIDSLICHGIDKLALSLGFVVVSEDSLPLPKVKAHVNVLNQWTYHARLYNAAQYACENERTELVQLVSFGCGVDAITTDEVRSILEGHGKLYTQIKIDEITNPGAVKIRLRSLIGAMEESRKE
ncbi:MAG: 2-hydroxyacyl-CoA dehydratase [Clostridia bacterium]|nr:2-hydroxyacyl-CoA dehydratase [Clostridia bacterium]